MSRIVLKKNGLVRYFDNLLDANSATNYLNKLIDDIGYKPSTSINDGLKKFIKWYKKYLNED